MPIDVFGNVSREDVFGRKVPKKQFKREILARNRLRGSAGENNVRTRLELQGYEVERTPRGKDFVARRRDLLSGRVTQTKHIEVKTGMAKLSKLQNTTKKHKRNYRVIRDEPIIF